MEAKGVRIRTSTGRVVDVRFQHYQVKQGVDVVLAPLKHLLLLLNNENDYENLTINDECVSTTFEGSHYVFGVNGPQCYAFGCTIHVNAIKNIVPGESNKFWCCEINGVVYAYVTVCDCRQQPLCQNKIHCRCTDHAHCSYGWPAENHYG
jgi:hypothetical protein